MPMDKTRGQNYDLNKLLIGIDEGKVALPDFQRDFDWTTKDVRALLATVLSGWPIGSLLLMQGADESVFQTRKIERAPELIRPVDLVVLDGQQRLTALYQALYGAGHTRYAVRLDLVVDDQSIDTLDEAIEEFTAEEWRRKYPSAGEQLKNNLVPAPALREAADFFDWRDEAVEELGGDDRGATRLYRNLFSGLHKYEVPAVVLDSSIPAAGIARIFERVNRTGMRLGTFDLMVAKSYTPEFNLRARWEDARKENDRLDGFFGEDGLTALNVIALRVKGDVRQQAVLEIPGSAVRDGWTSAVEALSRTTAFLEDHLGVWDADWLPYRNLLIVLAGLSYEINLDDEIELLSNWFWKTAFEGAYDVASNTRATSDYKALLMGDLELSPTVHLVWDDLLECNKRQFSSLHRAFTCFLASAGPRDLFNGRPLTPSAEDDGTIPSIRLTSLFPRDTSDNDPPWHLRTLAMGLVDSRRIRGLTTASFSDLDPNGLASQFIGLSASDLPEKFVPQRIDSFHRALSEVFPRISIVRREP